MWTLVVLGVAVLLWVTVLTVARIGRLDRLHRRTDAARAALVSALERRASAALGVAAVLETTGADPAPLRSAVLASRVAGVGGGDRETAENALGRALATTDRSGLPSAVLEELVDAEQLVILARRVHNDAVRDTLGLRSRRLVRWLRVAGTAPLPEYFEIVDAEPGVTTAASRPVRAAPVAPPR